MRLVRRTLIAIGVLDLLVAAVCTVLYALASSSQYSGFVFWITRLQEVTPGQAAYEESRMNVVGMLGRTSGPAGVALLALAITGAVCLAMGFWVRAEQSRRGLGDAE